MERGGLGKGAQGLALSTEHADAAREFATAAQHVAGFPDSSINGIRRKRGAASMVYAGRIGEPSAAPPAADSHNRKSKSERLPCPRLPRAEPVGGAVRRSS